MSHRKFEHPRHGSLGFLPRKRANRHRGKGISLYCYVFFFGKNILVKCRPSASWCNELN